MSGTSVLVSLEVSMRYDEQVEVLTVEVVEPKGPGLADEVEAFVDGHPGASLYHRPVFLDILESAAGHEVRLAVARSEGRLVGVLPLAISRSLIFGTTATSLPFFNEAGVLAADAEVGKRLAQAGWEYARSSGAAHLLLRQAPGVELDLPIVEAKVTVTLQLPDGDSEQLWGAIGSKPRNLVRKAKKAGLVANRERGGEALDGFWQIYSENLRDLGTPALGRRFFATLLEKSNGAGQIHLVRTEDGEPAAAALALRYRDRFEVPWASGLRKYWPLSANMLLYWQLLSHATVTGATVFDFGRSTPDSGPHRFKLQWGESQTEVLPWYHLSDEPTAQPVVRLSPTNPRFAPAIWLWKRLPLFIARPLGAWLARSLP